VRLIAGAASVTIRIDAEVSAAVLLILNAVSWMATVVCRRRLRTHPRPLGRPRSDDQLR
jgi:hypothetical protein